MLTIRAGCKARKKHTPVTACQDMHKEGNGALDVISMDQSSNPYREKKIYFFPQTLKVKHLSRTSNSNQPTLMTGMADHSKS